MGTEPCEDPECDICREEREENSGFFGAGHTPEYYLKKLFKLDCPDDLYNLALEITEMEPFTQDMRRDDRDAVKTVWDGNNLYHYNAWEDGFLRIQWDSDNGFVDWGRGEFRTLS